MALRSLRFQVFMRTWLRISSRASVAASWRYSLVGGTTTPSS